jgi:PAS domain S-box-containing protein
LKFFLLAFSIFLFLFIPDLLIRRSKDRRMPFVFVSMIILTMAGFSGPVLFTKATGATGDLDTLFSEARTGKDSLLILNELIPACRFINPPLALEMAREAKTLSCRIADNDMLARSFINLGHVNGDMGYFGQALMAYSDAFNLCRQRNNKLFVAECLSNIGLVYQKLRIYNLAIQNMGEAAGIYRAEGRTGQLAKTYNLIGNCYCLMNEYDKSMQYFNDVFSLPDDSLTPSLRALTYTNIADLFTARGNLNLADEFYKRAVNIYIHTADRQALARTYEGVAKLAMVRDDASEALAYYQNSSEIYREENNVKQLGRLASGMAGAWLFSGDHEQALQTLRQGLALTAQFSLLEERKEVFMLLSEIYSGLGDHRASREYYIRFNQVRDSIYDEQLARAIAGTETRSAFWKHEIDPDQIGKDLLIERYTRRFIIIILALSLITVILAVSRMISQRRANRILSHQKNILKKTVAEQRVSEAKYKALFSQANDAIFLMDYETFIDCNEKTLEMFACEREEIVGQPPYKFSPENQPDGKNSKEKANHLIFQCYEGKPQRFYWMHTRRDGTPFDAEVSLNLVNPDGKQYVQAIVRNISERVRAEKEMLLAREKAEKATESKTFFLAKMSHEIRTMLGGITSSADLLKNTSVDKHQSELLDIISLSAGNLLEIVNEILDFSKIEAGRVDIEERSFDLHDLLNNITNTFAQKAKEKKLELFLSIHPRVPQFIVGDELRLKQILANLLSNAIKFTENGSVTMEVAGSVTEQDKAELEFRIIDTGIGISPHQLKQLFSEYSQTDISISRRFGGTGLGLNIAYRLVTLMKGKVDVSSRENTGTTFTVTIPFTISSAPEVKADAPLVPEELQGLRKYRILLAEDNLINQKIILINLENLGHEVDIANDGIEAWKMYLENEYDLILMDIQMPEMDGIAVTKLIRKHEAERNARERIRIIALTANILGKDAAYCLSEGMDAYVAKPFRIEEILAVLEP